MPPRSCSNTHTHTEKERGSHHEQALEEIKKDEEKEQQYLHWLTCWSRPDFIKIGNDSLACKKLYTYHT